VKMSLRFISQSHVLTRVPIPFQIRPIGQIESPFLVTVHSLPIRRHHTVKAVVNTWQGKPEPEPTRKFSIAPFISSLSRPLSSSSLSVKMNSFTSNQVRTVASSTSRNEFLCIIPDKPGSLENRLKVRPQHLADINPRVQAGDVVMGGATLTEHPVSADEAPRFTGSAMIVVAENVDTVREILKNDIYATSGVWDVDNFKSAVRTGL